MIEKLLEILNIQKIWETIVLQFKILFDPETSFLGSAFNTIFDKVLNNPLASIITLLALVGLPYTLYKAKQSSTEANERLDQLIDEMKDFEFEKPLIDLQEKFKGSSFDNSPVINYDHDVLELNFEQTDPDYANEENTILPDLESTSFVKQITLDQEVTDDFLATGPMKLGSELNDEHFDFSPLAEDDKEFADFYSEAPEIKDQEQDLVAAEKEVFDETEVSLPGEFSIDEKEFSDFYSEAHEIKDQEQDLVAAEKEVFVVAQTSPPPPVESNIVEPSIIEEENASPEIDDLKTKMEQAIQKLKGKYSTPAEENDAEPVPSVFKKIKKSSWADESKAGGHKDTSSSSSTPKPADSRNGEKKNSLKKSHVITHLNSFQKNLEHQLEIKTQGFKKKSADRQQEEISSFETILKPTKITCPPQNKTTDEEYQQALESFLFLRDQKRTE